MSKVRRRPRPDTTGATTSNEQDERDLLAALSFLSPDELELLRSLALATQELGFTDFDDVPEIAVRAAALLKVACDRQLLAVADAAGIRLARVAI